MRSAAAWPAMPMTIVGCLNEAIGPGANAQRRHKGDTHILNALRTNSDRPSAPRSADPL
jgi:hypothetical protein